MPEIRQIFLTLTFVSIVILGMSAFIIGITSSPAYNNPAQDYSQFSQLNNVSNQVVTTNNNLTQTQLQGGSILDVAFSVVAGIFGIAKTLGAIGDLVGNLITDLSGTVFGIPTWIPFAIGVILGIIVFFELLSMAAKYKA